MGGDDDDGCRAEPLAQARDPRQRGLSAVGLKRDQVADHQVGVRVRRHVVQMRTGDRQVACLVENRVEELENDGVIIEDNDARHRMNSNCDVTEPQLSPRLKRRASGHEVCRGTCEEQHVRSRSYRGTNHS